MKTIPNELSSAFHAAAELRTLKQEDYGSLYDYFPFGAKSYCHELHKKTKRLVNLNQTDTTPNYESIQDNLIDLINYASFYYEYLLQEEQNEDIQRPEDKNHTSYSGTRIPSSASM